MRSAVVGVRELGVALGPRASAVRETDGSWFVFFAKPGERRPAFCLKVRKPSDSVRRSPRTAQQLPPDQEYRTLATVHEHYSRFSGHAGSVPRPILLVSDCEAILTDYAGNVRLKDTLAWVGQRLAAGRHLADQVRLVEICGTWLRVLHGMDPPEWLPVYRVGPRELVQRAADAAEKLPKVLRDGLPLNHLLALVGQASADRYRLAMSHGDFQPGNIVVSGSGVTVIDLGTTGVRPIEEDLAFFIVLLFTDKHRVVFGSAERSLACARRLCGAFLDAYGTEASYDPVSLRAMIALHVAERLAQMSATAERFPLGVRTMLLRRLLAWERSQLPVVVGQ